MVEQFKDLLLNTCFRFTQSLEDSEDLTQDVFIEAHRSINRFRGDSSLKTWLYQIAVRKSLDHLRKQKTKKLESLSDYQIQNLKADQEEENENDLLRIQLVLLKKALDRLNEKQRTAFTLNKFEGLTAREIAEIMNLKPSGVEALIHRAKAKLKKELEKMIVHSSKKPQVSRFHLV